MTLKKAFGQVIYRARQSQKLSQMELAARADLHLNTIHLVEVGRKSVQIESIFKLARGLNCPVAELMEEVEKKPFEI